MTQSHPRSRDDPRRSEGPFRQVGKIFECKVEEKFGRGPAGVQSTSLRRNNRFLFGRGGGIFNLAGLRAQWGRRPNEATNPPAIIREPVTSLRDLA